MMQMVATARAAMKPLKRRERRRWACWGSSSRPLVRTRQAYSAQRTMKMDRVRTCEASPASMMLVPMAGSSWFWLLTEAMPPPAPCSTSETKSQATKNCV